MNDEVRRVDMCEKATASCDREPSFVDRLNERRRRLRAELAEVDAALEVFRQQPLRNGRRSDAEVGLGRPGGPAGQPPGRSDAQRRAAGGSVMVDGIPRRCRIDLMAPAELEIRNAVLAVEKLGADPLLTDAVVLLQQAREKVADYIERCT